MLVAPRRQRGESCWCAKLNTNSYKGGVWPRDAALAAIKREGPMCRKEEPEWRALRGDLEGVADITSSTKKVRGSINTVGNEPGNT